MFKLLMLICFKFVLATEWRCKLSKLYSFGHCCENFGTGPTCRAVYIGSGSDPCENKAFSMTSRFSC